MFQKTAQTKKNTFYVQKLFFGNRSSYEIMWKKFVERG